MKKRNLQFKYGFVASFLLLFIIGCGGGGGSSDNNGDSVTNEIPVAEAGENFLATRNFNVSLDGSGSSDADGDPLTFTWTQTAGPDVTGNAGFLAGETPSFQTPSEVSTLIFELVVNDGTDDSVGDLVGINVVENENAGFFVDGDTGSDDTGTGSVEMPFASIAKALCEVTQDQQDIYVKTLANGAEYDETIDPCPGEPARSADQILLVPTGTSLYGGYDEEGVRDKVNTPTLVNTSHHGFIFHNVDYDAWFSGFNVRSNESPGPEDSVYALSVLGGDAHMIIEDSQLIAGDVPFGTAENPGSSYGLRVALLEQITIQRNVISAGYGGDGLDTGNVFNIAAERGENGVNAGGMSGAAGGDGRGPEDYDGGSGGNAGSWSLFCASHDGANGADGQGDRGGTGGLGGKSCGAGGQAGDPGGEGNDGSIGDGGLGFTSMEVYEDGGFFAYFLNSAGSAGAAGEAGHGGGGGGGGAGNALYNGGGGGGGGGGGSGGSGGPGGPSGGVSVGLFIAAVNNALIEANEISGGPGGYGATGGQGQVGGDGGNGGDGAEASAGNGGNGGSGGIGGDGGRGGAGGGGPSYGIAVGSNILPSITNNTIGSGTGGGGGFGGVGGNGGDGGDSYAIFDADLNDGTVPFISNNDLSFSDAGNGGGTSGEGGSAGATGVTGATNW